MKYYIIFFCFTYFINCRIVSDSQTCLAPADITEARELKAWGYFYAGLSEECEQNWRVAAGYFDKAANLAPGFSRVYTHLAQCLVRLGTPDAALVALRCAEKYADPQDYLVHFDIGNGYEALGNLDAAARYYQKSLTIFPHFQRGQAAFAKMPHNRSGQQN